jgi:FkbM family methyltransferase
MGPLARWGHAAVMALIRRSPLPLGRFMFRAYHKALRTLRPTYCARAYFGAQFVCDPRDLIQRMILYFGVWEPDVSRVIERTLSPGDVFVDIGANIGYDSLLASQRVGPTGRVVAIEASARTSALLRRNLALNKAANVRAINAAVADRAGRLDLYEISDGNIGAATTLASRGGQLIESVDAMPLEDILTRHEIACLRLIKIDIEGAEPPILRRLIDRLALYPAGMDVIVEASPSDDPAWRDVFDRLIGAGFVAYEIANEYDLEWYLTWRTPTPLRRIEVLPSRQQDLLFTRRPSIA